MASLSLGAFKQLQPTATSMPDVSTGIVALSVGCVSIHLGPEEADQLAVGLQRAAQQLRSESQRAAA
ncbi:hypothetical protein U0039_09965 [Stenotrophomonas maltophilia]|uniref:hypothetical protein n=1 Tax=Stenotrophomonas maltophilia TaxID=40324 RepID=UPI000469FF2B|nr:hypothetical protein [Stenotrophomonas maltophilia]OMP41143.1 hypothetical protein BMR86_03515 [Stenotrophomonas sp. KAs 5-3]AIL06941.1 hypothetical protein DP16_1939 [Stenotrophomonas maltophilia]OOD14739.1 hypothetical protein BWP19_10415 [Stenotrophomonas maltophilia]QQA84429.1 hypothetical protein I6I01_08565 [Stenotrophomonas maltophilia]WQE25648.1 hypothetical protein U0039_09965 [Stenotrophomonas maltophilia]